jgi:hypothetical protein
MSLQRRDHRLDNPLLRNGSESPALDLLTASRSSLTSTISSLAACRLVLSRSRRSDSR